MRNQHQTIRYATMMGLFCMLFLFTSNPALAQCVDADGDGFTTCQNDCDDNDPNVNPSVDDDDCDGFSDDCDSKIDEDYKTAQSECGVGSCFQYGNVFCQAGGVLYDTCRPKDPAENDATCDGKDDDCDGLVDEDYVPEVSSCGKGACQNSGTTICIDGDVIDVCSEGSPTGADDDCDGIDDDCDGLIDEHYDSLPTACGIGKCARTGKTYCFMGNVEDTCNPGNPAPADTTCDGKDDDCDGLVDEEYQPFPFSCGISVCQNTVMSSCVDGKQVIECTPLEPAQADDNCDGIDDDCDGAVDEHYESLDTACGIGACARTGKTYCMLASVYDTCNPLEPAEDDSSCNGKDDDCDGLIDEDFVAEVTECGIGACGNQGVSTCIDGKLGSTCTPLAPAADDATCDGIDDDCDGTKDENYKNTFVTCGEGACLDTGNIYCSQGQEMNSCESGIPGVQDETCDGVDDDCDGLIDEDFIPGISFCGEGVCATTGTTTCIEGQELDVCDPLVAEFPDDNCNGIDEDCDGKADEHFKSDVTTTCGIGKCAETGTFVCEAGELVDDCESGTPSSLDTSCNGIDDDCDGLIDEEYISQPVSCGKGVCASQGQTVCVDAKVESTCVEGTPSETDDNCNGLDEDCDGAVDEHFQVIPSTCGTGLCSSEGAILCLDGVIIDSCVPGQNGETLDATCDGVDDDCDGLFDEDFEGVVVSCGEGVCIAEGVTACVDGEEISQCVPLEGSKNDSTCDGIDDDCDGLVDEDATSVSTTCGVGACASEGMKTCEGGQWVDSCQAIESMYAADLTCDGVDEDCDGAVDEDYLPSVAVCGAGPCEEEGITACENGEEVSICTPGLHAYGDASCKKAVCEQDPFCCESGWDQLCAEQANQLCASCLNEDLACCSAHDAPGCGDETCTETVCQQDAYCCEGSWDSSCVAIAQTLCTDCMLPTTDASCCEAGSQVGCGDLDCQAAVCNVDEYCCTMGWDAVCVSQAEEICPTCQEDKSSCCVSHDGVGCDDAACEKAICDEDAYCCDVLWDATCALAASYVCEVCEEPVECCEDCEDNTCNGIDDDCDGEVDEDFPTEETVCGTGGCAATGAVICEGGTIVNTCMPGLPEIGDLCDGIDNDCDGEVDEDFIGQATECGVGVCDAVGATVCENGAVVDTCVAPEVAELDTACDGRDNDCDGLVDEDYVSVPGTCGVGACAAEGATACVEGVEVVMDCNPGEAALSDATCDGIDDDCDGQVDEDFVGEDTTCDVGACSAFGKTSCESGEVVDSCEAPVPALEDTACNGVDDDCDGEIDEDFIPGLGTCGIGACAAEGVTACINGTAVVTSCEPGIPAQIDDTCDGIDDDCDGQIDEDFVSEATSCDVGSCGATGETICVAGQILDTCVAPVPADSDTACNGMDDDCDGEVDEDYVSEEGSCGVGACASTGPTACEDGQVVVTQCTPGEPAGTDNTCDGIDDDCDGEIDEDYEETTTTCFTGVCASSGKLMCKNGEVVDTCQAPLVLDDNNCNGRDDDCDGEIDEDFVPGIGTCGVGACSSEAPTACVEGEEVVIGCVPGAPAASDATCDGIDDDCDGEVDEDFKGTATSCSTGTCGAVGETQCVSGVVVDTCKPPVAAADDSTCDGIDDDCDGEIDEDYTVAITSCGEGLCTGKGRAFCVNGSLLDTCQPKDSPFRNDVTCDGIDDDCDGFVDEDYQPEPTHCGLGACLNTGETQCIAGKVEHFCTPGAPLSAVDQTCDGVDDNCNGSVDEDVVPVDILCGLGACAAEGVVTCEGGQEVSFCEEGAPAIADSTCDGIDDDCDGLIDEDFMISATECGLGACAGSGQLTCANGQTVDTCVAGAPEQDDATCDEVDNDCDGQIDEDCNTGQCDEGFVVSQGDWSATISPFESGQSVSDFYAYGSPNAWSANTGLELSNESVFFLHRDPEGVLSFVMLHDAPGDGSGGTMKIEVDGLQHAEVSVHDDPAHSKDLFATSMGLFSWVWYSCCTDGIAFEYVEEDACFTITPRGSEGIEQFTAFTGGEDMQYAGLPELDEPFEVCWKSTCEEEPSCTPVSEFDGTCDGIDDDCDGEIDEDFRTLEVSCGIGACKSSGDTMCVDGQVVSTCEEKSPSEEVCDGVDNDCDGEVDEDTSPNHFVVTQGDFSASVYPIYGEENVSSFYDEQGISGSNTGLEVEHTSVWSIYEDGEGMMSLVIHNDTQDTPFGGYLSVAIDGLESGDVAIGNENVGSWNPWATDDELEGENTLDVFKWKWRKGSNDGLVVENIDTDLCITVRPRTWRFMEGFAMASGLGETIFLPEKSEEFTLCRAMACEPGVL